MRINSSVDVEAGIRIERIKKHIAYMLRRAVS